MRTRSILLTAVWLLTGVSAGWAAGQGPQLPPYRKLTLTNGLTLLLMEQHEVPLVSVQIVTRAGGVADPAGKEGLALLTAELLRRGTQRRTADQIASELDFIGGSLDTAGDPDRVLLTSEFMAKDSAVALDLLADLLQHPSFPNAEVEKLVKQQVDGIKQDKEEARAVLQRYFDAALFGRHPYARPPGGDERSLASLRRADVTAFYDRHYGPASTILAVVGDFESSAMEQILARQWGEWKQGEQTRAVRPPTPAPSPGRTLRLINKPDSTQTYFAIGNLGIARDNPDRTGIELVNLLFGGRFTSMLNAALRVESGLTYGARSRFERYQAPGPFTISSFTANATTIKAIDLALDVLQKLHREGITEDQLRSAKDYLKGQFPPHIETTAQLAAVLADLAFYDLNAAEVNELFQRIDAFTTAEARRIIQRYFPRESLVFVLIGKAGEIEPAVRKYAPQIEKRDIDQPGFE
jgi:zinc protease